jgi:hypothetical protein
MDARFDFLIAKKVGGEARFARAKSKHPERSRSILSAVEAS